MFRIQKLGLVFTLFALLILAAPALAVDQPFSSTDAHVDGSSITGTEATLGAYAGYIDANVDFTTGAITNGFSVIEFGSGSGNALLFTFEGQINLMDFSISGTFTIRFGTGALEGASGGGTFTGSTDGSTFDADLEGTLTLP
jgi:hypothetical protein